MIDYQVIGPYDMEQDLGLFGATTSTGSSASISCSTCVPRPGTRITARRSEGLYHGSCATHGGGGVNGIPGWQAYKMAKKDKAVGQK